MYRMTLQILLLSASLLLVSYAWALQSDQSQGYIIRADHSDIQFLKKHVTVLTGHVHAQQGSSELAGDKVVLELDKNNKTILKITNYGKPATYSTLQENQKEPLNVSADTIEYTPATGIMVLTNNAVVTQGNDVIKAAYIKYDVKKQIMISDGNKNNSQTTIILQPKDLN